MLSTLTITQWHQSFISYEIDYLNETCYANAQAPRYSAMNDLRHFI